jgi:hypothetical protein
VVCAPIGHRITLARKAARPIDGDLTAFGARGES